MEAMIARQETGPVELAYRRIILQWLARSFTIVYILQGHCLICIKQPVSGSYFSAASK